MIKKANVEKVKGILKKYAASKNDMPELLEYLKDEFPPSYFPLETFKNFDKQIGNDYIKFRKGLDADVIKSYYSPSGKMALDLKNEIKELKRLIKDAQQRQKRTFFEEFFNIRQEDVDNASWDEDQFRQDLSGTKAWYNSLNNTYKLWEKVYNTPKLRKKLEERTEKQKKILSQWKNLMRGKDTSLSRDMASKIVDLVTSNPAYYPGVSNVGLSLIRSGAGGAAAKTGEIDETDPVNTRKKYNILIQEINYAYSRDRRKDWDYWTEDRKQEGKKKLKEYLYRALEFKPSKSLKQKLEEDYKNIDSYYDPKKHNDGKIDYQLEEYLKSISE